MRFVGIRLILALVAVVALLAMAACEAEEPTATPAPTPTPTPEVDDTPIRVGLLPIIDSVPFYLAEEEGLFEAAGLNVTFETFSSALERNVALESGAIDGQLADLIATGLINGEQHNVSIVKTTYRATSDVAMIALVAGADSGIDAPADLEGTSIGISTNSLIEYHLDLYLDEAGLARDSVEKTEVASIPVRMELLSQGQLDAAVLPEPLITLAVNAGGTVILDDRQSRLGMSVLEFNVDYLTDHEENVKKFLAVHEEAVQLINANPDQYAYLLPEKARLPEFLVGIFNVPPFPSNDVPTAAETQQASEWLLEKGLIGEAKEYGHWVHPRFIP